MSVSFKLRTTKKEGDAYLTARIQAEKLGVNLLVKTPIRVDIAKYTASPTGKLYKAYMSSEEGARIQQAKLDIEQAINSLTDAGTKLDSAQAKAVIEDIFYREEREEAARREEEARKVEAEKNRMTLRKFIDKFRKDIKSGARLTDKGTLYTAGTINGINQACERLKKFEKEKHHIYDFDEIDLKFYNEYTAYLKKQDYAINTTGKCIKVLKQIMSLAESEGYHNNNKFRDSRFKGTRVEVDTIYLTKEDLAAILAIPEEKLTPAEILSRDIFMVGVWTAQRVSDYNHIKREDIQTLTKRWIEDVPDPEHPGQMKEEIRKKDITYINIRQKKTGAKVAIPCSSQLKTIMEKYGYQIPHQAEAVLNKNLKVLGEKAGLEEIIEYESTKGGRSTILKDPKWKLIHTHTARRTGDTLMYLAGMDIYDIMKITGHSTPVMLKKYIKADQLEVVEKITEKYDYFD